MLKRALITLLAIVGFGALVCAELYLVAAFRLADASGVPDWATAAIAGGGLAVVGMTLLLLLAGWLVWEEAEKREQESEASQKHG
jgi:hypothetical protein